MSIPLPNATTASLPEAFAWANSVTGNIFGILILVFIFFVSFIALKSYTTERAFIATSFITFLSSVFLGSINLIPAWPIILLIIMLLASVTYAIVTGD